MQLLRGTVVISLAGRDKDRYLAVMSEENGYVFLADGRLRSVSEPKKKNIKHIAATKTVVYETDLADDSLLRKAITERFGGFRR